MSFLVAVMPTPSFSLMMPFSCSSSRARASLVVSLGTPILMTGASVLSPLSSLVLLPQAARLRAKTTARARVMILVKVLCFMFAVSFEMIKLGWLRFLSQHRRPAGTAVHKQNKNSGWSSLTLRCLLTHRLFFKPSNSFRKADDLFGATKHAHGHHTHAHLAHHHGDVTLHVGFPPRCDFPCRNGGIIRP